MIYSTYLVIDPENNYISDEKNYWEAIELAKFLSSFTGGKNTRYYVVKSVAYVEREPVVVKEEVTVNYLQE